MKKIERWVSTDAGGDFESLGVMSNKYKHVVNGLHYAIYHIVLSCFEKESIIFPHSMFLMSNVLLPPANCLSDVPLPPNLVTSFPLD